MASGDTGKDVPKPWDEKWQWLKTLGGGGQGTTQLVRLRDNPSQHGVLKTLVPARANDPTSRQRMHQEVSNLQILGAAGAKVPKIYDSNTANFAGSEDLFFVMEYIDGPSLTAVMEKGRLSVDEAFDLALDLSKTLADCHQKNIMHRDLKPDNILIPRRNPIEAVIVDYGLSFNEEAPEARDLTKGDRIGNGFTDLPERGTADAQRHYESDITAVCGIFYYCVTGQRPTPFRDATNGLAPHRRTQPGMSMREAMNGHPATSRLETLFDQAFEFRIQDRIGTVKEFMERLTHAREATAKERRSLDDVLKAASEDIVKTSRTMQIQKFSECAEKVMRDCENELGKTRPGSKFVMNCLRTPQDVQIKVPADMEFVGRGFALGVGAVGTNQATAVEYAFAARGNQTAILRRRMKVLPSQQPQASGARFGGGGGMGGGFGIVGEIDQNTAYITGLVRAKVQPAEEWQVRLWYPGDGQPNNDELMDELTNCVLMQIEELKERLK